MYLKNFIANQGGFMPGRIPTAIVNYFNENARLKAQLAELRKELRAAKKVQSQNEAIIAMQENKIFELTAREGFDKKTGLLNSLGLERKYQWMRSLLLREVNYDPSGENELPERLRDIPMTMINIDLDNFKAMNDTFGHDAADEALIAFAQLLKRAFGRRTHDMLARSNERGDEFLILLPFVTEEQARRRLKEVEKRLKKSHDEDLQRFLSVGGGFSWGTAPLYIWTESDALKIAKIAADQAMYETKRFRKTLAS